MKAIIVGNAASLLNANNGDTIDSFDVVVRLNKFVIKDYEKYVGTKTNIFCSKWYNMGHNINNLHTYNNLWLPYPRNTKDWFNKNSFKEVNNEVHLQNIKNFNLDTNKFVYIDNKYTHIVKTFFKNVCQPSTGLIALVLALQELSQYDIYYTGFDNFSTGWYWDVHHNCTANMHNSIIYEKHFLNHLKQNCKIISL